MSHLHPLEPLAPVVSAGVSQFSRVRVDGKFLAAGDERFLVKGVTYGTFAPDDNKLQFPALDRVRADFGDMAAAGVNTVRVYTPPPISLLDAAAEHGLRVMAGVPWAQHVAFLDDATLSREARDGVARTVKALAAHPAAMLFAVGNEIPPGIVRWHGRRRIERFLADLYAAAKDAAPESLIAYVNFPPTEFLDLGVFDICAFNVYLHREADLRAYLARLHQIARVKPLLLAEAGADSVREGEAEQARVTAMHVRAAFEEGLCGAVAFAWTDEWWRGGHDVVDWRFGLVDAARQPKPALTAVRQAFADAPFGAAASATWPRATVVVCAYNAADTIGECLESLSHLHYPDYEVVVVNDGSQDQTGDIARRAGFARVIDTHNGGLSAARNVGLAHATGEIVAYTDSDVRVDRDWLAHLVQPFLQSDVVGSGGPNLVPADDPWVAQCVARAPGGPTHVLLDDRTSEHVPGCNMAFRKTALDAIGGFNPIYERAGDDVDVCWRLQARGWRIGFAPSALVWHRHRSTVKAYWRQQVGYGEGEVWLMHQHPDKFAGGHMIWRGHIYSSLPFVRALTRLRMNTGVWGLAAFPSVYHTGAEPWSFLPHSAPWHVGAVLSMLAGTVVLAATGQTSAGWLLLLAGLAAIGATAARCVSFARRTDLGTVLGRVHDAQRSPREWHYRAMIAWLHFVQPLARMCGLVRGWLEPPDIPAVESAIPESTVRPVPRPSGVWAALRLLAGASAEDRYWSERWLGVDRVLQKVLDALSLAQISGRVSVADGWDQRRDMSMALGRWAWFDLSAVVEEHAGARVLVRTRTHLRPSAFTVVVAIAAFAAILLAATSIWNPRWSVPAAVVIAAGVYALALGAYRTAAALEALRGVVRHAMAGEGATPVDHARPAIRFAPDLALWRYAAGSALASLFVVGVLLGGSLLMRDAVVTTVEVIERFDVPEPEPLPAREYVVPQVGLAVAPNGDVYLADAQDDVVRRVGTQAGLVPVNLRTGPPGSPQRNDTIATVETPGGVAVAPNGDLYIADTVSHRVFRVDRVRGTTVVVAGNGQAGFGGDEGPATKAMLDEPAGVAVDAAGNLYIADAANHRVRKVAKRTGAISTVAGTGAGEPDVPSVGDGDLATKALLSWPMDLAVASTGDIYVADTGHNRVRRIDGRTGRMSTVAGDGSTSGRGDGGPAVEAGVSAPTGISLVVRRKQVTLYIADASVGRVRVVTPDGVITSLALPNALKIGSPSRVAYHPRGFLYVAGPGADALAAVSLAPQAAPRRAPPVPAVVQRPPRRAM